jgi:hypothetical protein
MNDLLRDLADRAQFRVQQHIGLAIKWFARGEQLADFRLRIRVVQQWTVTLISDPFPNFFRRCPKADDQRVRLETVEIFRVRRQTAARGDDGLGVAGQFGDRFFFERAKSRFAFRLENIGDGAARAGLDHFVRVEIVKMQLFGDEPANGSLARAHETDEREIDDMAAALHSDKVLLFLPLDNSSFLLKFAM